VKLASDVEFHEDIRLLVYRPRGVIDEAAVKKIVSGRDDGVESVGRWRRSLGTDGRAGARGVL